MVCDTSRWCQNEHWNHCYARASERPGASASWSGRRPPNHQVKILTSTDVNGCPHVTSVNRVTYSWRKGNQTTDLNHWLSNENSGRAKRFIVFIMRCHYKWFHRDCYHITVVFLWVREITLKMKATTSNVMDFFSLKENVKIKHKEIYVNNSSRRYSRTARRKD